MIDNIAIEQNGLKKRKSYKFTKEILEYHYVTLNKSSREIGKEFDCDKGIILRWLNKFGINTSEKPRPSTVKDLTGLTFYNLKVISKSHKDSINRVYWNCKCKCGNDVVVLGNSLKTNHTKSCGCLISFGEYKKNKYVGELSSCKWHQIVNGAKEKGREFLITQEFLWELFLKQNRKCALTGEDLILPQKYSELKSSNASLDRIDSSKGYTEDNVWWVTKRINCIKMDSTLDDFYKTCENVYNKRYSETYQG